MTYARPISILIVTCFAAIAVSVSATGKRAKPATSIANQPTRVLVFNLVPAEGYDVRKNGSQIGSANASAEGSIELNEILSTGDQITISPNGVTASPPSQPTGLTAQGGNNGCADLTWTANPENDIIGYVIYYGTSSVEGGQSSSYDDTLAVGQVTAQNLCGLANGNWYFAIKAKNAFGLLSPYSDEASATVSSGTQTDTTPPTLYSQQPADGATGVPPDTKISFALVDTRSGVDTNSVTVTVNGSAPANVSFTAFPSGYAVVCDLGAPLPVSQTIAVAVSAGDLAQPPNSAGFNWSFTTGTAGDNEPPSFTSQDPAPGAISVATDAQIRVGVADDGTGVDLGNAAFYVNGTQVPFTYTGDASSAVLVYENPGGFAPGSTVDVRVECCDLSTSQNCATLDNYSFTVEAQQVSQAAQASINPDGYWADDPARPLEVNNLPMNWTVHIFDTSGLQVKQFDNLVRDGYDWVWDFRNDYGQPVARAIYVVRVTDEFGAVKNSGRFLVQVDL